MWVVASPTARAVFDWFQAIDGACKLARGADAFARRPATVEDEYAGDLGARGAGPLNAIRIRKHLRPSLAAKPVGLVAARDMAAWRDSLFAGGVKSATVVRIGRSIKAALNHAARSDDRSTNRAAFAGDDGFYGMGRPSFRRRRVAGGSEGRKGKGIAVLWVDLGKNVCSLVGLDAAGAGVMRRKVRRETLVRLAEKLHACIVGMEACCGSHHLGRVFASNGHDSG